MPPKRVKAEKTNNKSKKIDKLTPKEAILDYQISNLRDLISRLHFKRELLRNILTDKLDDLSRLKLKGEILFKETSLKLIEFSNAEKPKVSSDDTKLYLLETWKIRDDEEKETKSVENEIELTKHLTKDVIMELREWKTYSDETRKLNDMRIQALEKEYINMKDRFQSMVKHLANTENQREQYVRVKIEGFSENIRNSTVENLVNKLNKTFSQQMLQNKWLVIENKSLAEKIEQISSEIDILQKKNLEAVGEVFNNNLPHIMMPLSFSDNQVTEMDNLHTSDTFDLGICHRMFEFKKFTCSKNKHSVHGECTKEHPSTVDQKKSQSTITLEKRLQSSYYTNDDVAQDQKYKPQGIIGLGPLEKQAIFLKGSPLKIDHFEDFSSPEMQAHSKFNPDLENWPINKDMLRDFLSKIS
ncbi:unnamed protein product [Trichobilharzia regenti]|nr:unnamed protein product [Trichobilharzia regenti]